MRQKCIKIASKMRRILLGGGGNLLDDTDSCVLLEFFAEGFCKRMPGFLDWGLHVL